MASESDGVGDADSLRQVPGCGAQFQSQRTLAKQGWMRCCRSYALPGFCRYRQPLQFFTRPRRSPAIVAAGLAAIIGAQTPDFQTFSQRLSLSKSHTGNLRRGKDAVRHNRIVHFGLPACRILGGHTSLSGGDIRQHGFAGHIPGGEYTLDTGAHVNRPRRCRAHHIRCHRLPVPVLQ